MSNNDEERRGPRTFEELLEELLPPPDHPLHGQTKQYNLDAVKRGDYIASILGLPGNLEGKRILDVGCGTGGISVAFARMQGDVYAMEPNYTHPLLMDITIARAAKEGVTLHTLIGRGEEIPFADESFDIVILNDVLEHVGSPYGLMSEAVRVLGRDGLLYVSTPNKYSYAQILREGHSGLFGVSLLPPRLAAFYVTRIRRVKERYSVNIIHSYGRIKRYMKCLGVNYLVLNANRPARHFHTGHPDRPAHYGNRLIDFIVRICRAAVIRDIVIFIVTRPSLQPGMLEFAVSKGEIPHAVYEKYRLGVK
jgi:SAM-dependent methyltransferase